MPITGVEAFSKDLDKFIKHLIPYHVSVVIRKIVFEALRRMVYRTPSDEGNARASWLVTINYIPNDYDPGADDQDGGPTIQKNMAVINQIPAFCTAFITNNAPHIDVLDKGLFDPSDPGPSKDKRPGREGEVLVSGGYSQQAPNGIISVTFEELRHMFDAA